MPRPRQPYGLDPHLDSLEFSGIRNLVDMIPRWHAEARCAKEPDQEMTERSMFQEHALFGQLSDRAAMASPLTTLAMLLCSDCSVRRECLRAALDPPVWAVREDDRHTLGRQERAHRVFGVWGGTVELERHLLRDLPAEEAADVLERTFPERLQARLDAYWGLRNELRPYPTRPGEQRLRPLRKADRRIDQLLAKRQVKTRHRKIGAGAPGPGRGYLGPAGQLARDLGVSVSTARRRLRAA